MSTIENAQLNEGALAGRYALYDLSNSGKFTNLLNVLPRRVKIEILGNTLTVIKGSTVTILDGVSETDLTNFNTYLKITEDVSITLDDTINNAPETSTDYTKYKYLVYNPSANRLELGDYQAFTYHQTPIPAEKILPNTFVNQYGQQVSLPIGYFDEYNMFTQFNSIGFYDIFGWVDMGVEALCPDGRNPFGTLKISKAYVEATSITQFVVSDANTFEECSILFDVNGQMYITEKFSTATRYTTFEEGYRYISDDNYIYDNKGNIFRGCRLCAAGIDNGHITYITNFNTYAPVNFGEISASIDDLDNRALHALGKEDVLEHAYGDKYFHDKVIMDNVVINGGKLTNITIEDPLVVECPQISGDITSLRNLDPDKPYTGQFGGLNVKYDAYITSVGNPAENTDVANYINLIGASQAGKAGIIFGNKQNVRIMGDSNLNAIVVTLNEGGAILPDASKNNKLDIGSANRKFRTMYATTFEGTATRTYWADLAEMYLTDQVYPVGTIVKWGGDKELTIAERFDEPDIAGVISENPAYLMNSNMEDGQPLAIAGRVYVRVVGTVRKHDKIYISEIPGVGTAFALGGDFKVIGRALEDKTNKEEGLVLCAVHFSLG